MTRARDVRRCALQALYQFDAGSGADTLDSVRESLEHGSGSERDRTDGLALAQSVWAEHEAADAAVAAISPEWPTHRQPVVDRNILRLAHFEMVSGKTPPKVAINEAVELAREFSTEKSPLFVNGILDKIYRLLRGEPVDEAVSAVEDLPETSGDPSPAGA